MEGGLNKLEWQERIALLGSSLKRMGETVELTVLGSVPMILDDVAERTSKDMDVWKPASRFNERALRAACESSGLAFNPTNVDEPDIPYIQIINPGIVQLGSFTSTQIDSSGGFTLCAPPWENLIASKLCRASATDIGDIAGILGKYLVEPEKISAVIDTFPRRQRETATENMVYISALQGPDLPTRSCVKTPVGSPTRSLER